MRDSRRTRIVLAILLLVSLTLVILNVRGGGEGLRAGAGGILGPVENAAASLVRPVSDFLGSVASLGSKDQQIAALQADNDQLRQHLNSSEYARRRAQQLDDLLHVAGLGRYKTVPAQVIAVGPAQGFAWTVTIDAGRLDGLKVEQTVLTGQGLVGKTISVGATTSVVQLVSDASSTVGARLEGTGKLGLLNGTGDPSALQLAMLDPLTSIKVGDRLVKWATPDSPYVAGVPLGVVTEVGGTPAGTGQVATVRPFADLTALDLVGVVVTGPRTDPRDAVLPPRPPASASAPNGASPGASDKAVPSASVSPDPKRKTGSG